MLDLRRSDALALVAAAALLLVFMRTSGARFDPQSVLVPVTFAIMAWLLRGVDITGALAGVSVAFIFYGIGGWRLFTLLLIIFAITLLATKLGGAHERAIEIRKSHGRSASQVMSNLFVASVLLLFSKSANSIVFAGAAFAALIELAADTVSSELGEVFGRPTYLITTWRRAESGINGGISVVGSLAGVAAAMLVGASAYKLDLFDTRIWICTIAGIAGTLVDSLLGATVEARGWISNDAVNLISTAAAAILCAAALQLRH